MYSREERMKAIDLYIKYDKCAGGMWFVNLVIPVSESYRDGIRPISKNRRPGCRGRGIRAKDEESAGLSLQGGTEILVR